MLLYENTTTNNVCVVIGDSLAGGDNAGTPISTLVTLPTFQGVGWDRFNCAFAGKTAAILTRDPNSMVDVASNVLQHLSPWAPLNLAIVWAGSNDWASGSSFADCNTNIKNLCLYLKAVGCKVIVIPMITRTGSTAAGTGTQAKNNIYAQMVGAGANNWTNYADGFVDIGYMNPLGADESGTYPSGGGCNNGTYYDTDKTHLKAAGFTQLVSGTATKDLNSAITSVLAGLSLTKYPLFNQKDAVDVAMGKIIGA